MTWTELRARCLDAWDDWTEEIRWTLTRAHQRLKAVQCRVLGHLERVRGDWPEDHVCPRCGDTIVTLDFWADVVDLRREKGDTR